MRCGEGKIGEGGGPRARRKLESWKPRWASIVFIGESQTSDIQDHEKMRISDIVTKGEEDPACPAPSRRHLH